MHFLMSKTIAANSNYRLSKIALKIKKSPEVTSIEGFETNYYILNFKLGNLNPTYGFSKLSARTSHFVQSHVKSKYLYYS